MIQSFIINLNGNLLKVLNLSKNCTINKKPLLHPSEKSLSLFLYSDGRESSVVTKVFLVDLLDSDNRKQTKEKHPRSERQVIKPLDHVPHSTT